MLSVSGQDSSVKLAGGDSVRVQFDTTSGLARVLVGRDSLVFDLGRLSNTLAESSEVRRFEVPGERLRVEATSSSRRGVLLLESINGKLIGKAVRVSNWQGTLLLGR
jgi:hypothetical protein